MDAADLRRTGHEPVLLPEGTKKGNPPLAIRAKESDESQHLEGAFGAASPRIAIIDYG